MVHAQACKINVYIITKFIFLLATLWYLIGLRIADNTTYYYINIQIDFVCFRIIRIRPRKI